MTNRVCQKLLDNDLSGIQQGYQEDQYSGCSAQLKEQLCECAKEIQTQLFQGILEPSGRFEDFVKTANNKVNEAGKLERIRKTFAIEETPNNKNWLSYPIKARDGSFF